MSLVVLIVSWLVFGLLVGLVARALYPGTQAMGFGATALVGIGGSFVGGVIGNLLVGLPITALHGAGVLGSIIGALVVLTLMSMGRQRHA